MVLSGVNVEVRAGECVAIIGPNGAGKSTLLLTMLGLLRVAAGEVTLNGAAVRRLSPRRRGRWAAYVPQGADVLEGFTVFDVVAGGRYPHVSPLSPLSRRDLDQVTEALRRCGLLELAQRPLGRVSGGERQKALIAAAICQDADAMFLDEPDTALDPAYQAELARLLAGWRADGRTIVMITHDLRLPAALGSRIVGLRGGRVVVDGECESVLSVERLGAVFGAEFESLSGPDGRREVLPRLGA